MRANKQGDAKHNHLSVVWVEDQKWNEWWFKWKEMKMNLVWEVQHVKERTAKRGNYSESFKTKTSCLLEREKEKVELCNLAPCFELWVLSKEIFNFFTLTERERVKIYWKAFPLSLKASGIFVFSKNQKKTRKFLADTPFKQTNFIAPRSIIQGM